MKPKPVVASNVIESLRQAKAGLETARADIASSAGVLDLFEGPPLEGLNEALEGLQVCIRTADLRSRDPNWGKERCRGS